MIMKKIPRILCTFLLIAGLLFPAFADDKGIQPWSENPRYWQYEGKPVVLLGGTDDDNLFQWPEVKEHLDLLASVGGNYIRNTMSDRKDKGFELYPFKQLDNGQYDLTQWNPEYWQRFETMLHLTNERDIIVQIEVWDRFDYTDSGGSDRWQIHPYNPKNNVNYTYEQTGFGKRYPDHPGRDKQPFFHSIPGMKEYDKKFDTFRVYQENFIKKLLSHSLKYNNVLYCMNNETDTNPAWGQYWIALIRDQAKKAKAEVYLTDMFDNWDIKHQQHHVLYQNPGIYSFIDVSQNNHNKGKTHWDNIQWALNATKDSLRPINTVKIYGADTGRYGTDRDGQERFWRNIIGGLAATRFHRPDAGQGLNKNVQAHLRSMRMLLSEIDIFHCTPNATLSWLKNCAENEAYVTGIQNQQYALFFPNGGSVDIDLANGTYTIQWLHILQSRWEQKTNVEGGKAITLTAPTNDTYWVATIKK
jgi:hypothetical protein